MKKLPVFILTACLLTSMLSAALLPAAQSKREILEILSSDEVSDALPPSESIEYIQSADLEVVEGVQRKVYLIGTESVDIFVNVVYENEKNEDSPKVGPRQFRVEVSQICKK